MLDRIGSFLPPLGDVLESNDEPEASTTAEAEEHEEYHPRRLRRRRFISPLELQEEHHDDELELFDEIVLFWQGHEQSSQEGDFLDG